MVWLLLLFCTNFANADSLLLKGAHLVQPSQRQTTETNIVITDGKITAIGSQVPPHFQGKTLSLKDKWIIPGLTDMHTHSTFGNPGPGRTFESLTTEDVAKRMLYSGVTSFLDLFANEKEIFQARARLKSGEAPGARLFAAGPMLTCKNGHGAEFGIPTLTMDTPAEAREQIRILAREKPDVVKIAYDHARHYLSMDQPTMAAAVGEANRLNLKAIIHIGTWKDAKEAVLAGAKAITHLYEEEIPDDLVRLMKDRGVVEIPTMTYQTDLLHILEDRSIVASALLQAVTSDELRKAYLTMTPNVPGVAKLAEEQKNREKSYILSLQKLERAGVPLLTGTDGGDVGVVQGFSVHREMAIWTKAGLSPWTALAGSTTGAKAFLGQPSGIAKGDLADLVVLKASPLESISNSEEIELIIARGKIIDRSALLPARSISTEAN